MHFLVISLLTPYFETYDNMLMVRMNSGVPLHDNASFFLFFSFSFFNDHQPGAGSILQALFKSL